MTQSSSLPPDWRAPDKTLIVAGARRSGSTYLSSLIDGTGVLPETQEYFNDSLYPRLFGRECPTLESKLRYMDEVARSSDNYMSVKMFPEHMNMLLKHDLLDRAFPNQYFVFLRRDDVLGQAISMARAMQTEKWSSRDRGNDNEPVYDGAAISKAIRLSVACDAWWAEFFAGRDVPVLRLTYEQILADPAGQVGRVIELMELSSSEYRFAGMRQELERQSDELNEEWRERYLSEPRPVSGLREKRYPRTLRNALLFLKGRL